MRNLRKEGRQVQEIAEMVGVCQDTVSRHTRGINPPKYQPEYRTTKLWSEEEIEYLIEYYPNTTMVDLALQLGKTRNQVMSRVIGLIDMGYVDRKYPPKHTWTEEEINYIVENYGKAPREEVAKALGLEVNQITSKAVSLRKAGYKIGRMTSKKELWSEEQLEYLIKSHPTKSGREIAEHIGKNIGAVNTQIKRLIDKGVLQSKGKGRWRSKGVENR